MTTRPDWDTYFIEIAVAMARRADCRKRRVGAVIVKDNRIVSSGYNGSPSGMPGCLDGHCPRGLLPPGHPDATDNYETGPGMCISIHAEQNAVIYGDFDRMKGATIYVTADHICRRCMLMVRGAGIIRAVTMTDAGLSSQDLVP